MTYSPKPDLQRFLFDFVEGVEDLHILEWFRHLDAPAVATEDDVATAVGVRDLAVREILERLVAKGALEKKAGDPAAFRYAPPNPEFSATLDVVLERLDASPLDILRIFSANSIERLRLAALRSLVESQRGRGPRHE